ncbi:MAG TPA: aldehyde ferredoxin oxidoreductase C-terminal domain-containing protein, partial [bacterium]|nr:aldehyde ferredoxin oxidoreductase C-terminal domain-containing protein [bacterium]
AMLTAVTGRPYTAQGLRQAAATIHDLKKLFNQREGWTVAEDTLPARFFAAPGHGPASAGAQPGDVPAGIDPAQFLAARARYYQRRGWDEQGCLAPELPLLQSILQDPARPA